MLSLVTAAEYQYRHDARIRDREIAVRAAIRERAVTARAVEVSPPDQPMPRQRPATWARPNGLRVSEECTATACATA